MKTIAAHTQVRGKVIATSSRMSRASSMIAARPRGLSWMLYEIWIGMVA